MNIIKFFCMLLLSILSCSALSHVAGVTDTSIKIRKDNLDIIYTVPIDNLDEFTVDQKRNIDNSIVEGFSVANTIESIPSLCQGKIFAKKTLEAIQSEQFSIRYQCNDTLDDVSISYSLFLPEFDNHENHVRLSIARRTQSFTFSKNKLTHNIPVKKLLTTWHEALTKHKQKISFDESKTSFFTVLLQSRHYFLIGVEHILLGYDHVLFLIGLLLLPFRLKSIIAIATAFTIAHSITLGISVLGVLTLPAPYVEAVIALSIVYIAVENMWTLKTQPKNFIFDYQLSSHGRVVLAFCFGLLHGFGFSYVLKEIGLGQHTFGSLLFFNIGVEFGQLIIILVTLPFLWYVFRSKWSKSFVLFVSMILGLIGVFWLIERVVSLF